MPMQAESLEVLEKASVAPTQARAIVSEMRQGGGWSDTDKVIFAASVVCATIVGAIIVFA